jgi:elongation of very long chain fatty acids protein 6
MKNREPFDLRIPLAAWNLFLSLFSFYGVVRVVPHFLYRVTHLPFVDTMCEQVHAAYGGGAVGLATLLFCFSKIPELVDTVFIVLRKKPLIVLHWYHHVTVFLYCWFGFVTMSSNGLYFEAMNFSVHSVMYFYYFLQAIKALPTWFPAIIITYMQIGQMFVGTFIVASSWYFKFFGGGRFKPQECNVQITDLITGGIIYASYLILFIQFAFTRFGKKSSKKDKKDKQVEKED